MDTQSALAGIFDQICGEDEAIREKGIDYVSTSLVQMRHKLFIPHPENEKFLIEMIKKVSTMILYMCIFHKVVHVICMVKVVNLTG